ncbi:hypothetical protein DVH24_014392 [Malus domestica]|uniref:Uncharacterized protein n=1 Tax=Malus domestica TaxID=3750 RepID=A0A498IQP3_MALDO|nr:hypothetical protein DVH24_014392 [Malus domestica]
MDEFTLEIMLWVILATVSGMGMAYGDWCCIFFFHFFTLTIAAIFSYEPLSNLLMVWTHVPNYIAHRPRSTDGTALRLLPNDCRKQRLKSCGVAVWLIAWFTIFGALGLLPKDC